MLETDIPLYGATFLDTSIVVAGGGGLGRHGLPNKVLIISTEGRNLEIASEYEFPPGSDCPMSLSVFGDSKIVVGANSGPEEEYCHLRVFNDDLELVSDLAVFEGGRDVYQRVTAASELQIAIVGASNGSSSPLYVLDHDLAVGWHTDLKVDLKDLSFSTNGQQLAALEPAAIYVYQPHTAKKLHTLTPPKGGKFQRGQFLTETKYVVAIQFPAKKQVQLAVYEIDDKPTIVNSTRVNVPSVSALACRGNTIAIGSTSGDMQVFNGKLAVLRRNKGRQQLPISAVAISANGDVASTSVSGAVRFIKAPFGSGSMMAGPILGPIITAGWTALSFLVLAVLVWLVYIRVKHDELLGPMLGKFGSAARGAAVRGARGKLLETTSTKLDIKHAATSVASVAADVAADAAAAVAGGIIGGDVGAIAGEAVVEDKNKGEL